MKQNEHMVMELEGVNVEQCLRNELLDNAQ
jgi:hypothetical protein